jgi:hypothetical protein
MVQKNDPFYELLGDFAFSLSSSETSGGKIFALNGRRATGRSIVKKQDSPDVR